jgi:AraC-like DNA-binding protein/mannose-6-phosphate isomerase-like protein (cupin superfamily)
MDVIREITPLTKNDCFAVFYKAEGEINAPLHNHDYVEIKLILNGGGARRIVGNHIGEVGEKELVCIGANLTHGWFNHKCINNKITEVTLQFEKDLLNENLLAKNQLVNIRKMFEKAERGILFPSATIDLIETRILSLHNKQGFDSILELFSILNFLSLSQSEVLSEGIADKDLNYASRRIRNVFEFMSDNYHQHITLADVAKIANMAEASFSRFIRHNTGKSFIENLNSFRLGHVSRMLINTEHTISEISYKCGFNNMANFNRIFKKKNGMTPKEFRASITGRCVLSDTQADMKDRLDQRKLSSEITNKCRLNGKNSTHKNNCNNTYFMVF